jgi:hypothetical protein
MKEQLIDSLLILLTLAGLGFAIVFVIKMIADKVII